MVCEAQAKFDSQSAAVSLIGPKFGCGPETRWLRVRRTKTISGSRDGVTTAEADRIKTLVRESQPICHADEALKQVRYQEILHWRGPDTMRWGSGCERRWTGTLFRPNASLDWRMRMRGCYDAKAASLRATTARALCKRAATCPAPHCAQRPTRPGAPTFGLFLSAFSLRYFLPDPARCNAASHPEWMRVGNEFQPTTGIGFYRCFDLEGLYFLIYFLRPV